MGTTKELGARNLGQILFCKNCLSWLFGYAKNKVGHGPLSWREEAKRASFMAKAWSNPRYVVDCGGEVEEICLGGLE